LLHPRGGDALLDEIQEIAFLAEHTPIALVLYIFRQLQHALSRYLIATISLSREDSIRAFHGNCKRNFNKGAHIMSTNKKQLKHRTKSVKPTKSRKHAPSPTPKKPLFPFFRKPEENGIDLAVGSTTLLDILSPPSVDLTQRDMVEIDGVYHAYLYITGEQFWQGDMKGGCSIKLR
jgi:hypothetical protein